MNKIQNEKRKSKASEITIISFKTDKIEIETSQKVTCYYFSYSQPTISPSLWIYLRWHHGPLIALHCHQWKYSPWVLNSPHPPPPNLLEDFVIWRAEILFLISCYQGSLNPWSPSHFCTCGKNHCDLFSCLMTLDSCAADILSALLPFAEEGHGTEVAIVLPCWSFSIYRKFSSLLHHQVTLTMNDC